MDIKIKKGLNIPLIGEGVKFQKELPFPKQAALDLTFFEKIKFSLLVRPGDEVLIGTPLCEDKECSGRYFVSPVAGKVSEIVRGAKRHPVAITVETSFEQKSVTLKSETLFDLLKEGGLFAAIFKRPGNVLAHPEKLPKSIFVQGISTAPFDPPFEYEVEEEPHFFQVGLSALAQISPTHLVVRKGTQAAPFLDAQDVTLHTVEGPHPAGNPSFHIARIDPILRCEEIVWTLTASTVIAIGKLLEERAFHTKRLIALCGEGVPEESRGLYKVTAGHPMAELIPDLSNDYRIISGNPLMGHKVTRDGFLGFFDRSVCLIQEENKREALHFFRLGTKKFTATRTYLSGLLKRKKYHFTTSLHGEKRSFIEGALYDKVMPLKVPVMPLIKALLAKDYDLAIELGLLEVAPEDFALPEFICPSKTPMVEIVKEGLHELTTCYLI